MTAPHDHDDGRELLGAYALNALDADERAWVDELLLTDPSARAELHGPEEGAGGLGHASLRPPTSAWDAISAEVEQDLAADRAAGVVPLRRSASRSRRWLAAPAGGPPAGPPARVAWSPGVGRSPGPESVTSKSAAPRRDPAARTVTLRTT